MNNTQHPTAHVATSWKTALVVLALLVGLAGGLAHTLTTKHTFFAAPTGTPAHVLATSTESGQYQQLVTELGTPADHQVTLVLTRTDDDFITGEDLVAFEAAIHRARTAHTAISRTGGPSAMSGTTGKAATAAVLLPTEHSASDRTEAVNALQRAATQELPERLTVHFAGASLNQSHNQHQTPQRWWLFGGMCLLVTAVVVSIRFRAIAAGIAPALWLALSLAASAVITATLSSTTTTPTTAAELPYVWLLVTTVAITVTAITWHPFAVHPADQHNVAHFFTAQVPKLWPQLTHIALGTAGLSTALLVCGAPTLRGLGVACALSALSTTIIMACGLLASTRILGSTLLRRTGATPLRDQHSTSWLLSVVHFSARRPALTALGTAVVLLAASLGALAASTPLPTHSNGASTTAQQHAHQTLAKHFPAGLATPLQVLVPAEDVVPAAAYLMGADDVHSVAVNGPVGRHIDLAIVTTHTPGSPEAAAHITTLRSGLAEKFATASYLGGPEAERVDEVALASHDLTRTLLATILLTFLGALIWLRAPIAALITTVIASLSILAAIGLGTLMCVTVWGHQGVVGNASISALVLSFALFVPVTVCTLHQARKQADPAPIHVITEIGKATPTAWALTVGCGAITGLLLTSGNLLQTQVGVLVALAALTHVGLARHALLPGLWVLLGKKVWWPTR